MLPPTRSRALTAVVTVVVVVVSAILAGCGAEPNPRPAKVDAYVAMGDSYTALAGVGPFTDPGCRRSRDNYPNLVARDLGITDFTDASCGGATSASLTQTRTLQNPPGSRPPQLDGVGKGTKLVTLGIGLNNYQLAYYLLYVCVPINGARLPTCGQYLQLPQRTVARYVDDMVGQVRTNLKEIRREAPNARVVLVGYPRILADHADCPAKLDIPAAAADRLRSIMRLVNEKYQTLAEKMKVDYVDMWAEKGHDVCSTDPWMAGQTDVPGKALQFHPYESYHRAVADKILALLKK